MSEIRVGEPIGDALRRTGQFVFQPFSFKKWLAVGVAAWLTLVGEGGGGGNPSQFRSFFPSGRAGRTGPGFSPAPNPPFTFDDAVHWFNAHLALVISLVVLTVLIGFCIYVLYRWLNSRGQFMMFDHVVNNTAEIKAAWSRQKMVGNSLFRLRLVWDLAVFNVFLLFTGIAALIALPEWKVIFDGKDYDPGGWTIGAVIFLALSFLAFMVVAFFFGSFLLYMVVPVMYLRQMPAWPAWKLAWRELLRPNFWKCVLYFLMMLVTKLVEGLWAGFAVMLFFLVTCCIGWVMLMLPVIGTFAMFPIAVLCLPVLVYERIYCLYFIGQFGSEYRVAWAYQEPTGFPVIPNPPPA